MEIDGPEPIFKKRGNNFQYHHSALRIRLPIYVLVFRKVNAKPTADPILYSRKFRLHTEPQIGSRPQIRVNAVRQVGVRITSCIDQSCDVFGIFTISEVFLIFNVHALNHTGSLYHFY